MEDQAILDIWKSYGKQLETHLNFDKHNAEALTKLKIQSFLSGMQPLKIFALFTGIIWVCFVDVLLINVYPVANIYFLLSAGIQVLLTKLAIGIYLYQLMLIHQMDIDQPVLEIQEKISKLKSSTLWVAKILMLQLPLWTTFYWNKGMLENGNIWLYLIQILVTLIFLLVALWFFFNIRFENRHKKWFRYLFSGKEWEPVMKSMALLEEINAYRISGTRPDPADNK